MVSYKQQLQQTENKGLTKDYFSILASLALLILLILVIYPAIKHIAEINKEISDARVIKAGLEAKLDALAQARTNYDEVKNDLAHLNKLEDRWYSLMEKHTKKPADFWKAQCQKVGDRYFDAYEAKEWGLIDKVLDR